MGTRNKNGTSGLNPVKDENARVEWFNPKEKLHNHPKKEKALGLDSGHVIVDRDEWEEAKKKMNEIELQPIQLPNMGVPKKYLGSGSHVVGSGSHIIHSGGRQLGKTAASQIWINSFDPSKPKSVVYIERLKIGLLGRSLMHEPIDLKENDRTDAYLMALKLQIEQQNAHKIKIHDTSLLEELKNFAQTP